MKRARSLSLAVLVLVSAGVAAYPIEDYAGGTAYLGRAWQGVVADDPALGLINPAVLGFAPRADILLRGGGAGSSGVVFGTYGMAVVKPMRTESATLGQTNTLATLGFSLDNLGDDGSDYRESIAAVQVGVPVGDVLALGVNLKTLSLEGPAEADNGFGLDLGLQARFDDGWRLGFAAGNLIPPGLEIGDGRIFSERLLRAGLAYGGLSWLLPAVEVRYAATSGEYDYGGHLTLTPIAAESFQLVLSGGYRVESQIWGAGLSCRLGFVELAAALWAADDADAEFSLRLALSPDF